MVLTKSWINSIMRPYYNMIGQRNQRCPYCEKPICGICWNRQPRASLPWASLMRREPGWKTCTTRTTCWKTPRRFSASERDAAPCTNTARMGIFSGWKGMPQRTIRSGFPANTLMTNWGWFTTITAIIIPKMAGGLVGILPKKKKLTIYIGLSEIIRQYIWHIGKTMSRYVMGTTSCYGRIYKAHWKLF